MIRGISFTVPKNIGSFLYDCLDVINFSNYTWVVDNVGIYKEDDKGRAVPLFSKDDYDGIEFARTIKLNDYYSMFGEIKAFPKNGSIKEVLSYKDFATCGCELVVLITSSSQYEIYCKNNAVSKKLFANAERKGFTEISYIHENNLFIGAYPSEVTA